MSSSESDLPVQPGHTRCSICAKVVQTRGLNRHRTTQQCIAVRDGRSLNTHAPEAAEILAAILEEQHQQGIS